MLRKLRSTKAQNTAEYAILLSLVVAGIIAMQTYAQRALQARVRDASVHLTERTSEIGVSRQYEPYDKVSDYLVTRNDNTTETLDIGVASMESDSTSTRGDGGFEESIYGIGNEEAMPTEL